MNTLAQQSVSILQAPVGKAVPKRVEVDMRGVDRLSANEVASLTRVARENGRKGVEFVLTGVSARLQSVLEGLRFHRIARLESGSAPVRLVAAVEVVA